MSSRCRAASQLVSRPEIFCSVFSGRMPRSEMLLAGHTPGVSGEPEYVGLPVAAEFQQFPAGVLGGGALGAGDAGHVGEPGQHRVPELAGERVAYVRRDLGQALVAGGVPGADQASQRPLRLPWPDRFRPALGRVLEVPDQVHLMPTSA
jgi:hypothetical protein